MKQIETRQVWRARVVAYQGSAAIEVRPGYNSALLSDIVKTL